MTFQRLVWFAFLGSQFVFGQTDSNSSCISLYSSTICPSFQALSLSPTNLSQSWPMFQAVTDAPSFDRAAISYLQMGGTYARIKQGRDLECSGWRSSNYTFQYQQTVLCSIWTSIGLSAGCNGQISDANKICASTCKTFYDSMVAFISYGSNCPNASDTRFAQIEAERDTCLLWSTNSTDCIDGPSNQGNCGFGTSVEQLCSFCSPSSSPVHSCCGDSRTDLTSCGFTLSPSQIMSSSSPSLSITGTPQPASLQSGSISRSQIAGIILGTIATALLLLICVVLFCLLARRKQSTSENAPQDRELGSAYVRAPTPGTLGMLENEKSARGSNPPPLSAAITSGNIDEPATLVSRPRAPSSRTTTTVTSTIFAPTSRPGSVHEMPGLPAEAGRVLLLEYQDTYSSLTVVPGSIVEAIFPYQASLSDELTIAKGDTLEVLKIYDDNWAQGRLDDPLRPHMIGAFPLVCVTAAIGLESSASGIDESTGAPSSNQMSKVRELLPEARQLGISERGSSHGDSIPEGETPVRNVSSEYFPSLKLTPRVEKE